jgi:hypothetical protein
VLLTLLTGSRNTTAHNVRLTVAWLHLVSFQNRLMCPHVYSDFCLKHITSDEWIDSDL